MRIETSAQTAQRERMTTRKLAAASAKTPVNKELFMYKGLQYNPSRQPLWPIARSEDWNLNSYRRPLAWATADDLVQNFTLAGWMIRHRIDRVASFGFQPLLDDQDENQRIRTYLHGRMHRKYCDVSRRWDFDTMFRAWAGQKHCYGDAIMTKAPLGQFQLFESWNIAKGACPTLDLTGKPLSREMIEAAQADINRLNDIGLVWNGHAVDAYGIATGDSTGSLIHRMLVPWDSAIYAGDFTKPSGMRPGSRLLPAMNFARDSLDNIQFRLTQSKVAAMFGMAIFRDHQMKGGFDFQYAQGASNAPGGASTPPVATPGTNNSVPYLSYNLQPGLKLELESTDRAEFLESKMPSAEWLNFNRELFRAILAAEDIPLALYDPTGANLAIIKVSQEQFRHATHGEREDNKRAYSEGCLWMLNGGVADGTFKLPKGIKDVEDIPHQIINKGTWLLDANDKKEIREQVAAGHLDNVTACEMLGNPDFFETTKRLSVEQKFQRDLNVTVVQGLPGHIASTDQEPPATAPKPPED